MPKLRAFSGAEAKNREVRGMKEELRGSLRSLQDRDKNRDEFVAFLPES